MHNILIVEDDSDMCDLIRANLERDGYAVTCASDAQSASHLLRDKSPDLILLDIGLPDGSGLNLMSRIKEHADIPVIMVSGNSDPVDKSIGIEMGADDYIGKPFQMRELSARVKAQIRRLPSGQTKTQSNLKYAERLKFGTWVFDRPQLQVFDEDGNSAGFTVKEFQLLEVFLMAPERALTREQLLDLSRSYGFNVTDRAIDTQILRIRKKLGDDEGAYIRSVRGVGYMFAVRPEPEKTVVRNF